MTGDFFINNTDAFKWKATMQAGSMEELLKPAPAKPFVENKGREMAGKQILAKNPQPEPRTFSLTISIQGETREEYLSNYKEFFEELAKGVIEFKVPIIKTTFKLVYKDASMKMNDFGHCFSSHKVKFEEPNPSDR